MEMTNDNTEYRILPVAVAATEEETSTYTISLIIESVLMMRRIDIVGVGCCNSFNQEIGVGIATKARKSGIISSIAVERLATRARARKSFILMNRVVGDS